MKRLITQLKCLYTNMGSMGNKQEKLEISWWDESHHWDTSIKGYNLLRKERLGRRGRHVVLCVIDCEELPQKRLRK